MGSSYKNQAVCRYNELAALRHLQQTLVDVLAVLHVLTRLGAIQEHDGLAPVRLAPQTVENALAMGKKHGSNGLNHGLARGKTLTDKRIKRLSGHVFDLVVARLADFAKRTRGKSLENGRLSGTIRADYGVIPGFKTKPGIWQVQFADSGCVIYAEFDTLNHLMRFPAIVLPDETRRVVTPSTAHRKQGTCQNDKKPLYQPIIGVFTSEIAQENPVTSVQPPAQSCVMQ